MWVHIWFGLLHGLPSHQLCPAAAKSHWASHLTCVKRWQCLYALRAQTLRTLATLSMFTSYHVLLCATVDNSNSKASPMELAFILGCCCWCRCCCSRRQRWCRGRWLELSLGPFVVFFHNFAVLEHILCVYIYIYMWVCVCVCAHNSCISSGIFSIQFALLVCFNWNHSANDTPMSNLQLNIYIFNAENDSSFANERRDGRAHSLP